MLPVWSTRKDTQTIILAGRCSCDDKINTVFYDWSESLAMPNQSDHGQQDGDDCLLAHFPFYLKIINSDFISFLFIRFEDNMHIVPILIAEALYESGTVVDGFQLQGYSVLDK